MLEKTVYKHIYICIYLNTRWFNVTFWTPSWRLKGSLNSLSQKSTLTKNCQVRNDQTPKMFDDLTTKIGSPSVRSKSWMVKSSNLTSKFKSSVSASNQTIHLSLSVTPGVFPGNFPESQGEFFGEEEGCWISKCRKKLESPENTLIRFPGLLEFHPFF